MTAIRLEHVSKRLGTVLAVDDVVLEVAPGEIFFLLGPSGCGKTTLLNLVAGLLEPSAGRIFFGERDVTELPTNRRNAVMCFQSYALWPHLDVGQNVSFGLELQALTQRERAQRVDAALELVRMEPYRHRKPAELSGGQQQRVAIARAIAVRPACLLLDEPLSNLDARLRQQMRSEIRSICRSTGLTTLYVTHDQKEALSVADRIAILEAGRVVQVGTPRELYTRPRTAFVAAFLGHANLIPGKVVERRPALAGAQARLRVETPLGDLWACGDDELPASARAVCLAMRPEQLRVVAGTSEEVRSRGSNAISARVLESWFLGDSSEHLLDAGGCELRMQSVPPRADLPERVGIELEPSELVVLEQPAGTT